MTPWATPPNAKPASASRAPPRRRGAEQPGALRGDAGERGGRQRRRRDAPGEPDRAADHAERPAGHEQTVAGRAGVQHVGDEEELRGDRHREEQQRGDRRPERDRERPVADSKASPPCRGRGACSPDGARRARSATAASATAANDAARPQRELDQPAPRARRRPAGRRAPSARAVSTSPLAPATCSSPAAAGTSANSAGWADRDADAEQRGEREQHGERAGASAIAATTAAWASDTPTAARVLDPVDEPPGDAAEPTTGPQGEEERRHGERGARRADVQRERDPQRGVAEGRQADGPGDQADVADAQHGHGPVSATARVRTVILP